MSSTLQLQPATSPNIICFDPVAPSGLTRRAQTRRPVRALSLAVALVAGIVIGGLISLDAASGTTPALSGAEIKTESVSG